jgi:exodeoxyribonuclease III
MKIASFNINNVSRRLPNLIDWLRGSEPDVVCLQELKCADADFPAKALREAGYEAAWRGQPHWNGVAILARRAPIIVTRTELPGDANDPQSRYLEAAVNGVLIASIYAPNGNPHPGPKFDYKLQWMERLIAHAAELAATGAPIALAGDFNVVPSDLDIYKTKSWDRDALLQPAPRAAYRRLLKQGWKDAVRELRPEEPMYTFWDYKFNRWARDGGLRIDHILVSPALTDRLADVGVDRDERGKPGASDHAPVWVELSAARRRAAPSGPRSAGRGEEAVDRAGLPGRAETPAAPLLAIDGDNFAHRGYHAIPKTIRRAGGKGAGAIVGFANALLRFYDAEQPRAVIVGWDSLDMPNKRRELFPAYQGGRNFDDDLIEQLGVLPEFVAACGFTNAKAPGYEADDFLAAAVAAGSRAGGAVLVASGDRDAFQLASERTTILYPVRAGEVARIGPEDVRTRYGVDPQQVPDFIALRGDPSDRIPGARGVGPQRAADLLRRYRSLDGVLEAGLFPMQAEALRLYRALATMDASAPLPSLADQKPTWAAASDLARRWDLKQLADRLAERAGNKA